MKWHYLGRDTLDGSGVETVSKIYFAREEV